MQSHDDRDFRDNWMKSLKEKAEKMRAAGESSITGGKVGEEPLEQWKSHRVGVVHLPDDEHGILRISIGSSDEPVELSYCVFRGNHNDCCNLLRRALAAMEKGPS